MIPLVRSFTTKADREFLAQRLAEGMLDDEGEVTRYAERARQRFGAIGVVPTNSGTSGLHLALLALGVGGGTEVIVPSYTCIALLHAVRMCGAIAVPVDNFHDVREADFHFKAEEVRRKLTSRTKAIIASHMFGRILNLDELKALGVPIVEDFTLSVGAREGTRLAGAQSEIAVCSTHWSKLFSTGQGGLVLCHDRALLEKARALANYDGSMGTWRLLGDDALRGKYEPAFSYGLSPFQAALGNSQLLQLDTFLLRRRAIAATLSRRFQAAGITCPREFGEANVYSRYMLETKGDVPALLGQLLERGIQAGRGVFPPLHLLLGMSDENFPGCVHATSRMISVPLHHSFTDTEVDTVATAFVELLKP